MKYQVLAFTRMVSALSLGLLCDAAAGQCQTRSMAPLSSNWSYRPISAMTAWDPDGSGPLSEVPVASGRFFIHGLALTDCIAAWRNESWEILPGLSGANRLTTHQGTLIAGSFRVSAWNGAQWQQLGDSNNGQIYALTSFEGDLIAAGTFTSVGGVIARRIARWDGTQWRAMGDGFNDEVGALTTYQEKLIAGGFFSRSGTTSCPFLARWNGALWEPLPDPPQMNVRALAVYNGSLIAGGYTVTDCDVHAFDGVSWKPLGAEIRGGCQSLAVLNGWLIAGGNFAYHSPAGVLYNYFAQWNGSRWQTLGPYVTGGSPIIQTMCRVGDDLFVGGSFDVSGTQANWFQWGCPCYPNCDNSTATPSLTANDFQCFINQFAAGSPHANCDNSESNPLLTVNDLQCFLNRYAAGCP